MDWVGFLGIHWVGFCYFWCCQGSYVFSYGEYDPWTAGCIRHNLSDTVVAIEVPQGAHHLDQGPSDQGNPYVWFAWGA